MPTVRERVLEYLHNNPTGADDDTLAAALNVPQRQAVNQVCRQLELNGSVQRQRDRARGKIVNYIRGTAPVVPPSGDERPVDLAHHDSLPTAVITLADANAVREFAYGGEVGISEDEVKHAVHQCLIARGWDVDVRWGHDRGIDIEARRGTERLVLEAKGEGSLQPMRVNYFVAAIGELVQRMDAPDVQYGLAFPAHSQFAGLVSRFPDWVRSRLNLQFYFVRRANSGYDVALLNSGSAMATETADPALGVCAELPTRSDQGLA